MDHSIFYGFFTTLLGGDETAGVELFDWMKGLLVTPEIKPHKAIALVGPPGCGKRAVAELLRRMLGGGAVLMGEPYSWIPPQVLMDRTRCASDVWDCFRCVCRSCRRNHGHQSVTRGPPNHLL